MTLTSTTHTAGENLPGAAENVTASSDPSLATTIWVVSLVSGGALLPAGLVCCMLWEGPACQSMDAVGEACHMHHKWHSLTQ